LEIYSACQKIATSFAHNADEWGMHAHGSTQ